MLGSVAFLVALWTNEALPLGVVSLLPVALFPALGILSTNSTSLNYSKSIIFLFLGGFLLALAVEKTELHKVIARKLIRFFPATPRGVIFALGITSAFLSAVLSNTTTALLLLPLAHYLGRDTGLKMRLVLAISFVSSIGGVMTPIGTPPNLILLGFLEQQGMAPISFIRWMMMTVPVVLPLLGVMAYLLGIGTRGQELGYELSAMQPMTVDQKRLFSLLGMLALLLLLNSPIQPWYGGLGINEKGLILFFGLLMFSPKGGFLQWEDTRRIPYEIIFLFGAGFSIAAAFTETGFDQKLAATLLQLSIDSLPVLVGLIALFVSFATGLISNTALTAIMLPVVMALATQSGVDGRLLLMVATICASYAFMLPISTPPNAIAMSSGVVTVRQMAAYGLVMNLAGVVLVLISALFYWPLFH